MRSLISIKRSVSSGSEAGEGGEPLIMSYMGLSGKKVAQGKTYAEIETLNKIQFRRFKGRVLRIER
jgi:hypothetical protein